MLPVEKRRPRRVSPRSFKYEAMALSKSFGLYGLDKGFKDLERKPEARALDHAEWLGLLLEYELTMRRQKPFETRAREWPS